jgi:hypothetical protein
VIAVVADHLTKDAQRGEHGIVHEPGRWPWGHWR